MLHWLKNRRRRLILERSDTSAEYWSNAWNGLALLHGLTPDSQHRLRELATLFLHEKAITPAHGMRITRGIKQFIALQCSLPVLGLELDWYRGWHSLILYPDTFISAFDAEDGDGVVHKVREARSGESWDIGPLILSWADALASGEALDGYNVIIHECAHKLDALDGAANGRPPLHRDMSPQQWTDVFGAAYEDHCQQIDRGACTGIDPYAAEAPEEFFAVLSEAFFETPAELIDAYPDVYGQLRRFYRQDPVARLLTGAPDRPAALNKARPHGTPDCRSRRAPSPGHQATAPYRDRPEQCASRTAPCDQA